MAEKHRPFMSLLESPVKLLWSDSLSVYSVLRSYATERQFQPRLFYFDWHLVADPGAQSSITKDGALYALAGEIRGHGAYCKGISMDY